MYLKSIILLLLLSSHFALARTYESLRYANPKEAEGSYVEFFFEKDAWVNEQTDEFTGYPESIRATRNDRIDGKDRSWPTILLLVKGSKKYIYKDVAPIRIDLEKDYKRVLYRGYYADRLLPSPTSRLSEVVIEVKFDYNGGRTEYNIVKGVKKQRYKLVKAYLPIRCSEAGSLPL